MTDVAVTEGVLLFGSDGSPIRLGAGQVATVDSPTGVSGGVMGYGIGDHGDPVLLAGGEL